VGVKKAARVGDLKEKECAAEMNEMDDVCTNQGAYVSCSVPPHDVFLCQQYKASYVPAHPSHV
jgi:hypothetical protein